MIRFMHALLGMLMTVSAFGADWVAVSTGDGNQHFYDRSKVFVSGEEVTYWRRVLFATAHPVKGGFARSAMYRERINCKQHRVTTFGYLLYSADGTPLENVYTPDAEASAIVPETVGDRFERIMCAMVASQPESSPPTTSDSATAKKTEGSDELRKEIDRLELQLKRLRERLGERPN
jgi:hypothetical protein